jgi:hypothetical protein
LSRAPFAITSGLTRTTATAQRLNTARSVAIAPNVEILAQNLQFPRQGPHVLARQHPADDHHLEISTENTGFLGHAFSDRELSLIFRVSLSGCSPVLRRGYVVANLDDFIASVAANIAGRRARGMELPA